MRRCRHGRVGSEPSQPLHGHARPARHARLHRGHPAPRRIQAARRDADDRDSSMRLSRQTTTRPARPLRLPAPRSWPCPRHRRRRRRPHRDATSSCSTPASTSSRRPAAAEGLAIMRSDASIRLVLLDMIMPVMDGWGVRQKTDGRSAARAGAGHHPHRRSSALAGARSAARPPTTCSSRSDAIT